MEIELQLNSIKIPIAYIEKHYPLIFSALQPYLPVQKPPKRRRPRRKKQTVADLIDALQADINRGRNL